MELRLNLGCGNLYLDGYKNIDISKEARADEYYDVTKGIKEKDDSVDAIYCGCMLEQIHDNKDFIFVMNECYRVLKSGCLFMGYVPSNDPKVMFQDPMDYRFFKKDSFNYFIKTMHHWQEFGRVYGLKGWGQGQTDLKESGILHFTLIK